MQKFSGLVLAGVLVLLAVVCVWVGMDAFMEPHPEVPPLQLVPEG